MVKYKAKNTEKEVEKAKKTEETEEKRKKNKMMMKEN